MPHENTPVRINVFLKRLGMRLRSLRGEASLREFAPKVGLDARALNRIERGEHNVTLETLATICQRLKCTAGSLLDEGMDSPAPTNPSVKKKTASHVKKPS